MNVALKPVYSRVELGQVEGVNIDGNNTITGFTVEGVYVTDYNTKYTVGGTFAGTYYEQDPADVTFSGVIAQMKDAGTWAATSSVAKPADGKVWAYNTPSGRLPRLIIKLTNVTGTKDGNPIVDNAYYLTLSAYTVGGDKVTAFERGKVYKIASLQFNSNQFKSKPNDDKVDLSVKVTIEEWELVAVDGEL